MPKKDFLKKVKGSRKAFEKARKAKANTMGSLVQVDPGSKGTAKVVLRLHSVAFDVNKNNDAYVRFNTVCVSSEDENNIGKRADRMDNIRTDSSENELKSYERICKNFQAFGVNTEDLTMEDLIEEAENIVEDNPACNATVKQNGDYTNVYYNTFLDDDSLPELDELVDEDEDEDETEEEEDDDDDLVDEDDDDLDEEDEDEDEDEDFVPEKGMTVVAKPKGTKREATYEVRTSSKAKSTCTLIRERDDKKFVNVPWDLISGEAEDDDDE